MQLKMGTARQSLHLAAPAGLLILPHTAFEGHAISSSAAASICHFERADHPLLQLSSGFVLPDWDSTFHLQNLINLSLDYAEGGVQEAIRNRLLLAILDCFSITSIDITAPIKSFEPNSRLTRAWRQARGNLSMIRDLTDVAAVIDLSESTFRALHKQQYDQPAGQYLRELRLAEAERLLATTGDTVSSISAAVGYAQPESFSHAFSTSRGRSPAAYRRWCKRFA
ncbi:MAG: helix-turn-helix transcriptional regulator [Rhizobiaceae bacterium]